MIKLRIKSNINAQEFSAWALTHSLFESTHKHSRFLDMYKHPQKFSGKMSIVFHEDNGIPVSIGIFEHYESNSPLNSLPHFTSHGKKLNSGCIGRVGVYVKPKYRQKGLGNSLVKKLIPRIKKTADSFTQNFKFIAAASKANSILSSHLWWSVTNSTNNPRVWLDTAKSMARNHQIQTGL